MVEIPWNGAGDGNMQGVLRFSKDDKGKDFQDLIRVSLNQVQCTFDGAALFLDFFL